MKAWDESDAKLVFRPKYEMRATSVYTMALGAVFVVVATVAWLVGGDASEVVAIVSGGVGLSCVVAGGVLILGTGGAATVDPAEKTVSVRGSIVLFSDIGFVVTFQIMVHAGKTESPIVALVVALASMSFLVPAGWMFFRPISLVILLLVPLALVGQGPQTLVVDDRQVSFTGLFKGVTLSLDKLEMIREDERTKSVEFITDERSLRAHLGSTEAATWLRLRVENHLLERARA